MMAINVLNTWAVSLLPKKKERMRTKTAFTTYTNMCKN